MAAAVWSRASALFVLVSISLSGPAFAQSPLDRLVGRPISEVRLLLAGRPATELDVGRVLETEVGAPLSTSEVRESIVHLMALSRFEDVRVSADALELGGVRLTYDLMPLRAVKGVQFRGSVVLSTRQLRNEVTNRYGTAPPASRADEMARALEAYYHDRGFLDASIRPSLEAAPGARHSTLFFDVNAGPRAVVGDVSVEGTPEATAPAVAQRLGLTRGAPFDPSALRDRVTAYVDDLRGRGFIEAKVEVEPGPSGDGDSVDVRVTMRRGPHVTLAFRGDPLPASRRDELATLRREGTIDQDMLENEQRSLEDDLRAEGFRDAEVSYVPESRAEDEIQVVFTIRRGPQYRVGRVDVTGNQHLSRAVLQPSLRLLPGQWFVKSRLDSDLAMIAERYRRDGFRDVKVQPIVAPEAGAQASLDVVLAVTEGPRTLIEDIEFVGNSALSTATLRRELRTRPGAPFYEPAVNADRDGVLLGYLNRGYQLANVDVQQTFTPDRQLVALRFIVSEGPQIRVDHVLVVGNVRTKAATIEREVGLRQGMPLSLQELAEAQARLNALGLFRRVQVAELQHGSEISRDVLVIVEEAQPNTIGYGGGLEVLPRQRQKIDMSPRGFVEYGRRNLWGKNRSFNLFARAAVRTIQNESPDSATPTSGFREYRLLGTYREPRVFGGTVDLGATAVTEQASRPSFDFERRQFVVEGSHRFGRTVTAGARYTLGRTRLFNEQYSAEDKLLIDRVYGQSGVKVSSFSTSITRNTRDDAAEPTRGTLLLLDGTLAAQAFGSDVGFLRGFAQGFAYKSVPVLRGSVLAVGARLGLVTGLPTLLPTVTPDGRTVLQRVLQVHASERFFAGGDNTVRGFGQDQLGVPEVLDSKGVSSGGNAVVIFNGELRFPVLKGLGVGGVAFLDVGNVFQRVHDVDLAKLRTGMGFGIRWRSPLGPLRVDLGWKATQHRYGDGTLEPRFGGPYVSIGQAF